MKTAMSFQENNTCLFAWVLTMELLVKIKEKASCKIDVIMQYNVK